MRRHGILVLGVAVCLTGAALMAFGEGLIGENHAGIASVIGIVGIGLIGSYGAHMAYKLGSSSERSSKGEDRQREVT